ncbi:MAG: branched-chain-amino-acid transaminase [Nitrospirae bacterium]|nr:branched-chain-amino-acid transaminase [Nitrospirota bacterium]
MIYLNNKLVTRDKALISVFDHGFLYGDGVYETLRAYNGVAFMFDEHIERLFRSAAMIGLKIPMSPADINKAVYKTIRANKLKEAFIRINISRGVGPIGLDPRLCPEPTFVIICNPFKDYPEQYYEKGVKVVIVNVRRNFKNALNPMIKSLNFLNNVLANMEGIKEDAHEAIMLNYKGYIAEGTTSNIFFIKNKTLFTPELEVGILDGITRRIVLNLADEAGMKLMEGRFIPDDVYDADEVFISSTTREIMPVTKIDDIKIGSKTGKITKALLAAYRKKVDAYIKAHK